MKDNNGYELTELEKHWNGVPRYMMVWNDNDKNATWANVIGINSNGWVYKENDTFKVAEHAAECVKEEDVIMTNKQLSVWACKGLGQIQWVSKKEVCNTWSYSLGDENKICVCYGNILIRPWGKEDWVKPLLSIYKSSVLGEK